MDVLANKLEGISQKEVNSEKLAAYVEPERENQQGITRLIWELMVNLCEEMQQQVQHLDAQIMALLNVNHLTGTNPNSYASEPMMEDLFALTVATLFTYNKAAHIGVLALYRRHSQLLGPNAELNNTAVPKILYMHSQLLERNAKWNNRAIPTILDTSQDHYHLVDKSCWLPLKELLMRRKTTNTT